MSRYATDVPLARYDQGELGVVLPSYARVYLYPAWRAIVLGRDGVAAHAATPGGLGAYLALRTQMRQASLEQVEREERRAKGATDNDARWATDTLAAITARGERILADRQLAAMHEPVRATLRAAQFRLTPERRLQILSDWLDDPRHDPYKDSALGDWRRLAAQGIEFGGGYATLEPALRQRHAYFDWMRTLQRCIFEDGKTPLAQACVAERAHALERWQASTGGEKRAWLVAAMTLAESLTPALEAAAQQVAPRAPEYLSLRYHLARLYRLAGQARANARGGASRVGAAAARAAAVRQRPLPVPAGALRRGKLARRRCRLHAAQGSVATRPGHGGGGASQGGGRPAAADGLVWLNTRVSAADLLAIGRDPRLAPERAREHRHRRVAAGRLTGQGSLAKDAARDAQSFAGLREAAGAYLAASPSERRHVLLVSAVRLNMTPEVHATDAYLQPAKPVADTEEQPTAGMWCHLGTPPDVKEDPWNTAVEKVPPPPDLSTDPAARDKELATLRGLKTATGFFGEHVLARARSHPQDPQLPWLLHVVVQSTKGGCVDTDNSRLSRTAWQLLHSRYKESSWAGARHTGIEEPNEEGRTMAEPLLIAQNDKARCEMLPALANRHGLITGATGTGKTVTLQTLAEGFSRIGVPVFMADVKGDLTGISQPGSITGKLAQAIEGTRPATRPSPPPAPRRSGTCSASRATRCAPPSPTWARCCWRAC